MLGSKRRYWRRYMGKATKPKPKKTPPTTNRNQSINRNRNRALRSPIQYSRHAYQTRSVINQGNESYLFSRIQYPKSRLYPGLRSTTLLPSFLVSWPEDHGQARPKRKTEALIFLHSNKENKRASQTVADALPSAFLVHPVSLPPKKLPSFSCLFYHWLHPRKRQAFYAAGLCWWRDFEIIPSFLWSRVSGAHWI